MPGGRIQVLLVSAKGLHDTDFFTKMDPYVTLTCRTQEQKSSVASGQGSSPEWNETFEFSVTGEVEELVISIKDSDVGSEDDLVGEAKIPLEPLFLAGSIPPTPYNVVINDEFCGEVKVGLDFIPEETHEYEHGHEHGYEHGYGHEHEHGHGYGHEHGHGHHEEEGNFGGWKESSY